MVKLTAMPARLGKPQPRLIGGAKPVDPFYMTREWRGMAATIKSQRGYVCEACGKDCRARPFEIKADHIVAIKDGGAALDPLNIQLLCAACDNRKRAVEHRVRGGGG